MTKFHTSWLTISPVCTFLLLMCTALEFQNSRILFKYFKARSTEYIFLFAAKPILKMSNKYENFEVSKGGETLYLTKYNKT